MEAYDIIIAGAGPAGSMAALMLSRAGKKVLVLEKDLFPRTKVCGYTLNPRIWSVWKRHGLAESFQKLPHFNLAGFTLEREGTPVLRHHYRERLARAVDRAALDAWLAEEAQAAGATYQFGVTIQGITPQHVQTSQGEIKAPLVIGADGRNSVVGRLSGLARPSTPCDRIGWQGFINLPSLDDHVHMNVFQGGYYGLARVDDSRVTFTLVLLSRGGMTPDQILNRYLPGLPEVAWKSIHPISRRSWDVTNGRVWLIGDAARVLEPLTGEGIYSALATSEMAARNILAMDRIGVKAATARYRRQHRRFYGLRIAVNSFVRWSLIDSRRTLRILGTLQRWPALIAHMIDWVQSPETSRPQEG